MVNKVKAYFGTLKGNERGAKAKRNILYSFVLKGISIVISIGYVPLFLGVLDKERYGVWLTFLTIINWFAFFDIGLGNGLRNKLAISLAHKDYLACKKYISTAYAVLCLIFFGLALLFLVINRHINWNSILNTQLIGAEELFLLTNVVVFFFCIRFVFQIIQIIYFSVQKPSINNLIDTLGVFLSFLILLCFKLFDIKVSLVQIGIIVSALPVLLFFILSLLTFYGSYSYLRPSISLIDFSLSKDLMGLGGKFFIMQVTSILIFSTSNIFITQFYGPQEVARFNICFKLFQVPIMFSSIILSPIWSAVTEAYAKKDFVWLKSTLRKLNWMSLLFCCAVILIIVFTPLLIKIWIKGKIIVPYSMAISMGVYTLINIIMAPFSNYVNGLGKLKLTTALCFVGVIVYFVLVMILTKYFNNSSSIILAMAVASVLGLIIQSVQSYKIVNKKATGIWNE